MTRPDLTVTRTPLAVAALAAALGLAGCSGDSTLASRATTLHGKHGWKTCEQLSGEYKSLTKQIDDLVKVQQKAEQEAAGVLIGAAVYGPTLAQTRGERLVVEETMQEKRCPRT